MSVSKLTVGSVCLNLLLAVVALALSERAVVPPTLRKTDSVVTKKVTRLKREMGRVKVAATNAPAASFHWRSIESDDYRRYVANLRAIGCPEPTIRDIIEADLTDLYLRRRRELFEPLQRQFWDLAAHGSHSTKEKFEKDLEKLGEETTGALDEILGSGSEEESSKEENNSQPLASFLSEEKQQRIAELNERFMKLRQDIAHGADGSVNQNSRERFKEIDQQKQDAIKQTLTSEEFEEYQLRSSRFGNMSQNLHGFEATEEDLRAVAKVQLNFTNADGWLNPKDADYQAKLAQQQAAKKQRDEQLKDLLGEGRFAEFKRAQDGEFQQIYRVAERFDLPAETAAKVDDIRKAALEQAQQVRKNQTISTDQCNEILAGIQRETEKAISQTFGETAAKTYKKYGGEWVGDLGKP